MKFHSVYVPNLRFNVDTNYIDKRLKDLCYIMGGYAFESSKMKSKGTYQIVKMGNLYNDCLDLARNPSFIDSPTQKELEYSLKCNDIIITLTGTVNKKDYGYTVQIKNENHLLLNQRCALIRAYSINAQYLYYLLKSSQFKNQFFSSSTGGTGNQTNVSANDMLKFSIRIPDEQEQLKIGRLFHILDERIQTQIKIIDAYLSLIKSLRDLIFVNKSIEWIKLKDLVQNNKIILKRGNIIPKHNQDKEFKYPVYSSSIKNDGLMGYSNEYMFNQELITWSIDGGGDFFYRNKHKFNVTNVSGIMLLNSSDFDYLFLSQALIWQHGRLSFDYQSKAHPSVIENLYKVPNISLQVQKYYSQLFRIAMYRIDIENQIMNNLIKQKNYLLKNMFI